MDKKAIEQRIMNDIQALDVLSDKGGTASLFIHADMIQALSHTVVKGNMPLLAQAIGSKMENNSEFKRLMYAFVGSFLSNNPEEKDQFIATLKLDQFPLNMN